MFDKDIYVNRRKALKDSVKQGVILFFGNDETPMNYPDNPYHFRQHSSFLYYFGLDYPALSALIDLDNGTETIFGDDLSIDDIVWTGKLPTIKEMEADLMKVKHDHKNGNKKEKATNRNGCWLFC